VRLGWIPYLVVVTEARTATQVRLAELMGALSLALDLGTGRPVGHELGVCLSALELADRLGCPTGERSAVYYVALLAHLGCSAAAPDVARWVGGDEIHFQRNVQVIGPAAERAEVLQYLVRRVADDRPVPERVRLVVAAGRENVTQGQKLVELMSSNVCDGVPLLARRLHLPESVATALGQLMERWDGHGGPRRLSGEEIARPQRILRVAHDLVTLARPRSRRRPSASRPSARPGLPMYTRFAVATAGRGAVGRRGRQADMMLTRCVD
jgi:hypothetical protein